MPLHIVMLCQLGLWRKAIYHNPIVDVRLPKHLERHKIQKLNAANAAESTVMVSPKLVRWNSRFRRLGIWGKLHGSGQSKADRLYKQ